MVQQGKNPVLSLRWFGLNPWPKNVHMPWVQPGKKKRKERERERERENNIKSKKFHELIQETVSRMEDTHFART